MAGFAAGGQRTLQPSEIKAPEIRSPQEELHQVGIPDDPGGDHSIVGLWLVTLKTGGVVVDQGIDQWHSDGTEILNDTPAPASGNVCLGIWERVGRNFYRLKHPGWRFDAGGNLIGSFILREQITVSRGGDNYTGVATLDFFDLSGSLIGSLPPADVYGQRITVD